MPFYKTPVAADLIPCTYTQLVGLLRYRKIEPPQRDSSGDFIWTEADLDRARKALAAQRKPRKAVTA
jgi:hypothetical protein